MDCPSAYDCCIVLFFIQHTYHYAVSPHGYFFLYHRLPIHPILRFHKFSANTCVRASMTFISVFSDRIHKSNCTHSISPSKYFVKSYYRSSKISFVFVNFPHAAYPALACSIHAFPYVHAVTAFTPYQDGNPPFFVIMPVPSKPADEAMLPDANTLF